MYSFANGIYDKASISATTATTTSHATESKKMAGSVVPIQKAFDSGINSDPDDNVHAPVHDQRTMFLQKKCNREHNHDTAATTQETKDKDKPHNSVAPRLLQRSSQIRMDDDEIDGGASKLEGRYSKGDLYETGELPSLSGLQTPLPSYDEAASLFLSVRETTAGSKMNCPCGASDSNKDAALGLPDLQTIPNDLEAFLNESDSDLENTSPSIGAELARDNEQKTKQRRVDITLIFESGDDHEEADDQDRFASYNISKKNRANWKRQHEKDLRQLNAALNAIKDPFTSSAGAVASTKLSVGTSDVMDAICKAQEDAMRMLPIDLVPEVVYTNSSLSSKSNTHKQRNTRNGYEFRPQARVESKSSWESALCSLSDMLSK
ncbi:unnamed protein product [Peronospora belbahrii]|uniref:Uncharacterized protein n=1 Tax=Peronospora belbahrii TaxID=622444 RepID=A0AAU9L8R3_9STRA|nr:unnamed protein product [Peronospora belbahrii]